MQAKYAPIAPVSLAASLQDRSVFGDYHLLLAHDVLRRPQEYAETYKNKGYTIIMDNSMIELGEPLHPNQLAEACILVGATYVVLPDVAHDCYGTVIKSCSSMAEWSKVTSRAGSNKLQFMGVAQGKDYEEYIRCAKRLIDECGITLLGVPKSAGKLFRTRHVLVGLLGDLGVPIHLLGFTDDLHDDMYCASLPSVMGIDSAMPVWMGQRGVTLPQEPVLHSTKFGSRPSDFFEDPTTESSVCTLVNINVVRSWLMPFEVRSGTPKVENGKSVEWYVEGARAHASRLIDVPGDFMRRMQPSSATLPKA